ncbi:MAG TPA: hypothetical protein VJ860_20810 [Polyangia bacterium]|nr:hypothetical protein [Polyangia bacterium]
MRSKLLNARSTWLLWTARAGLGSVQAMASLESETRLGEVGAG